ncbi:carboxymuconolactone decarboxylase family protein [Halomarina halobia]|uniref:Carboxymuconolactone decarboxylase family protein n=1 Tax=Halomarina halobia TaxID=3033386 RepID=A0ABD6AEE3_9EURY|nr:carboxymuconolactone decarboxylase family protein [Halomarina sp. PSR21]
MARIELADRSDLPPESRDLVASLSAKEGLPEPYRHLIQDSTRNVYRALALSPPLLEAFRTFGRTVWADCGLSPRRREITILTVGRALDAAYEWHQHVRIGLQEGLTSEEIAAIGAGADDPFDAADRTLIAYTRAHVLGNVDDDALDAFIDSFDESSLIGVSLLAGIYTTIAQLGDALALETEEPFVGWDLTGL